VLIIGEDIIEYYGIIEEIIEICFIQPILSNSFYSNVISSTQLVKWDRTLILG
jgi:hypothetical protein